MNQNHEDRNLLLGILAVQMGFVTRDDLITAMSEWAVDRARPLGAVLAERKALGHDQHQLLVALVNARLVPDSDSPGVIPSTDEASAPPGKRVSTGTSTASVESTETAGGPGETMSWGGTALADAARRFLVLRPHARGGIGKVSVALDVELNREVALKELLPDRADDPQSRARFLMEAEVTGRLEHPGVVPVYALGADVQGRPYYAMRFVRGETLRDAIARYHTSEAKGPRDPGARALEFRGLLGRLIGAANAVAYAHSRGIVHRDLKPSNILLGPYGETLVVDWGLAKFIGRDEEGAATEASEEALRPASASGSSETVAGTAIGTPAYMSPEQAEGRLDRVGPLSDVYGLGATLYSLLTNEPPVPDRDQIEILRRVRSGEFPSPREVKPRADRALEAVCLKAMALRPSDRYPSARALAEEIEHWMADEPVTAFREPPAARLGRWTRRHRAWTRAGAASLLTVTLLAVVSALAIQASRDRVRMLLRQSEIRSANLALDRALALAHDGRVAEGMLWMTRALETAPRDEPVFRHVVLTNLNRWRNGLHTLRERLDHKGRIVVVAFRPRDGRRVLTASDDGTARLWDAETGQPVGQSLTHADFVLAAAFHPDGRWVATASRDGTARLWDAETGRPIGATMTHGGWVTALAFSPDGKRLVTGSRDKTARLWDAATGEPLTPAMNHEADIDGLAYSPDSRWVVTLGGKTARLWDAATGAATGKTFADKVYVRAAAFRPDSKVLATAGYKESARLWDVGTGQPVGPALAHDGPVTGLAFDPEGKWLATAGQDRKVRLWDAAEGKAVRVIPVPDSTVLALAFSPDGRTLATGGNTGSVRLWNTSNGHQLGEPLAHADTVMDLAFSPDGRTVATAGFDRIARLWDAALVPENVTTVRHDAAVDIVTFSPDGRTLASAGVDKTARLWDARSGRPLAPPLRHDGFVQLLAFRPDGHWLATGGYDHTARIWDLATGASVGTPLRHDDNVYGLAFSPDGRILATGGADKTARLWDADSGAPIGRPIPHPAAVKDVAFRPDGRAIATACDDRNARLWAVPGGELIGRPMGHDGPVYAVAFDPQGKRLATGGDDKTARLWDAATGAPHSPPVLPLEHQGKVVALAFSPDSGILATASFDRSARLWDAATGAPLGPPLEHQDVVYKVAFSPDGRTLASASQDRTVRLWDVVSGRPLGPPLPHDDGATTVAFSPDGRTLASGARDGAVHLWHPPGPLADEPERIAHWIAVLTELEFARGNATRRLDSHAWREHRRRLAELGGPPPR